MSDTCESPQGDVEILDEEAEGEQANSSQDASNQVLRSSVYLHFTLLSDKKYFQCHYCSVKLKKDASGSTNGMRKHILRRHKHIELKSRDAKQQKLDLYLKKTDDEFDSEVFEELLLKFIIATNQPFVVVNSEEFREFATYNRIHAKIPKNDTLKSRCAARYEMEKNIIIQNLQKAPGKIAIILDCWTSKNFISFQGIIATWISSDWKYEEVLLDLDVLESSHTGKNLAHSLAKVLEEFQIIDKIISITADNASNCDTLVEEFHRIVGSRGITFVVKDQRVRCLAHIVNLACQDSLNILKRAGARAVIGGLLQEEEDDLQEQSDDSCDEQSDALALSDDDVNCDVEVDVQMNSVYQKIRAAVAKIRKSGKLRTNFKNACKIDHVKPKMLQLDVKTRWNSTFSMLKRVSEMRMPFEAVLRGSTHMSCYSLLESEWNLVEQMMKLLKPFYDVTLMLSKAKIPTMSLTAAVYIKLYNHLESYTEHNCHPDVFTAAKLACTKLNKYYPSSDGCVYVMGLDLAFSTNLVLDPRCKLQWYKNVGIANDVVKLNKQKAMQCWTKHYAESEVRPVQNLTSTYDLVASQMTNSKSIKPDEFKTYLSLPVVDARSVDDILIWWKDHQHEFSNVSKMARDFLAINGTSVPIERTFSFGSDLLSPTSLSMNADTIRKRFCLKAWLYSSKFVEQKMKSIATKMSGCS